MSSSSGCPQTLGVNWVPGAIQSSRLDAVTKLRTWAVRDRRAARRGRDGGGVPGARYAIGARGCDQSPAGATLVLSGSPPAVRAGGQDDLAALAPAYLRALRRGESGRRRVPGHGAAGRRDADRSAGPWTPAAGTAPQVRH